MLKGQVRTAITNDLDMLQRSNLSERRFRLCETNKDMAASYNKHCVNALLEPLFEIIGEAVQLSLAKPLMHNYKPRTQRMFYIEALEAMLETMPDNPRTVKEKLKTGNSIVVIGVFTDSSDEHRVYAVYRNLTSESFHLFLKDGVSVLNISPFGQVTIDNGKIELLIGVIKIDELIGKYYVFHCYVASGWDFALKRISGDRSTGSAQYVEFVKTVMKKTLEWYNTEHEGNA